MAFIELHFELLKFLNVQQTAENMDKIRIEDVREKMTKGFIEHGRSFDSTLIPALVEKRNEDIDGIAYMGIYHLNKQMEDPTHMDDLYLMFRPFLAQ
jgi:hypothetical protein